MEKELYLSLNLQLFAEGGASGVEGAGEAGQQNGEQTATNTGVEGQSEAGTGAAPAGDETAWAKRLAAIKAKTEQEVSAKFQGYDDYKFVADYLAQYHNVDLMTLKERIELERLQDQAEKQHVPVEVMRRLKELEAKAAQADELAQRQQYTEWERSYWDSLSAFSKEAGIEAQAVNQFLVDNGLSVDPNNMAKSFELARKAIQFDAMQQQLQSAEKDGMKKLIGAKGAIPTIPGTNAQGQIASTAPKTFAEARARAMQRMSQTE